MFPMRYVQGNRGIIWKVATSVIYAIPCLRHGIVVGFYEWPRDVEGVQFTRGPYVIIIIPHWSMMGNSDIQGGAVLLKCINRVTLNVVLTIQPEVFSIFAILVCPENPTL